MSLSEKESKQLKAKKHLSSRARDTRQSLAQIGFLGREINELAHATRNGGKLSELVILWGKWGQCWSSGPSMSHNLYACLGQKKDLHGMADRANYPRNAVEEDRNESMRVHMAKILNFRRAHCHIHFKFPAAVHFFLLLLLLPQRCLIVMQE